MNNTALYAKYWKAGHMDSGKRQHLQDIYASDQTTRDDYTPQVSQEMVQERKRDMRRHQLGGFIMGLTILVLGVALVWVVVSEYVEILNESNAPETVIPGHIPSYDLPTEQQWVIDFNRQYADPEWDGEGERPFNSAWLKKAAYNVIHAEQAYRIENFGEAVKFYENVLEIFPEMDGIKVPLGMAYFKLEKYDKMLALLENASAADLSYDVLNNVGVALIEAEAYERAEEFLTRALELEPGYAPALKNLAKLQGKLGNEKKAIANYEEYLDQSPLDTKARFEFALYLTRIGEWELAAIHLRDVSLEYTDNATLFDILAKVEMKLGNDRAAIAALQRSAQLSDPKRAIAKMDENEFDTLREHKDFQALINSLEQD